MSLSNTIICIVLCAIGVVCTSASLYNCENGMYDTLSNVMELCRSSSYSPSLRDLRKKQSHVSGKDVADMLQDYCSVATEVTTCAEGFITDLPCLREELENFHTMNRRSNWFCEHNNTAKAIVTNIYENLPEENLNYKLNQCYKEAPSAAYPCIRRYLNVANPPKDKRETMKRTLSSFRCTFRKLYRKCGRERAILLTTLEYDWLIIPPAFGINVSDALITVANIKFS
uniref:DUF19 domain-containing protein n=1 Tax=Arion vulgaris TaxID=1028688 RepID=A0A0B6XZB7_9EUPU